ncbi:MAG: SRPBCC family protein [Acidimicrobiales bacterium]
MAEPKVFTATFTAQIAAPIGDVFALVADVTQTSRWRARMDEVAWIEPGTTFRVVSSFGPWRKVRMSGEVTAHEAPRHFAYRITEGPLKAHNEYRLEPDGEGTWLTMTGGAGMGGLVMRVLGPLVARAYTRTTRKEVARLIDLLEGRRV